MGSGEGVRLLGMEVGEVFEMERKIEMGFERVGCAAVVVLKFEMVGCHSVLIVVGEERKRMNYSLEVHDPHSDEVGV